MLQWVLDLLPDLTFGETMAVVRDVVSIGLAALGAYLAYLAIKMGTKQGQIAERQAEISEMQHKILEGQLAKRPDLRVRASGQNRDGLDQNAETIVRFNVMNGGNRTADECHWEILIPSEMQYLLTFIDEDDTKLNTQFTPLSETDLYERVEGYIPERLFPGRKVDVVRMKVQVQPVRTQDFWVMWRIKYEEGIVPASGFTKIHFKIHTDKFYKVKHDVPNVAPDDCVQVS